MTELVSPAVWTAPPGDAGGDPALDRALAFDAAAARRFLEILTGPKPGCVELRVLKAACDRRGRIRRGRDLAFGPAFEGATLAGWFDDLDRLVGEARRLVGIPGYVTINPVDRDLLARSDNRLARTRHATRDADVVALRWLYLDIDPVRPADTSATDAEHARAAARRDAILGDHPDLAHWAAWGSSGNGSWILVRLPDYPRDPVHQMLVRDAVAFFDRNYSDQAVKIDPASTNPARLISLPGTVKAKGSNRPERPWRKATLEGLGAGLDHGHRTPRDTRSTTEHREITHSGR